MITGILKPTKGQILISGKDIQKDSIDAKKKFGYVPDSPEMFLRLKGIEYLNFIADVYEISSSESSFLRYFSLKILKFESLP